VKYTFYVMWLYNVYKYDIEYILATPWFIKFSNFPHFYMRKPGGFVSPGYHYLTKIKNDMLLYIK